MPSSNPADSADLDRGQNRNLQNPRCFGDARDSKKTTRFWQRDAKCKRRTTPCTELYGRYRTPKQLARNAKNPELPRELKVESRAVLRTGQEPNFSPFFLYFLQPDGKASLRTTSVARASNEPLRISLGIVTENGARGDSVSKVLAQPHVLYGDCFDRPGDCIRDVFANPL